MEILNFPLYYISFKPNSRIENHYQYYGFTNVNHHKAVDGRKLSVKKLLRDDIISIRVHDDLRGGRMTSGGMPSMGGIGCTLSHYELWKLCVEKNYPFIIVTEEDNRMIEQLTEQRLKKIKDIISRPNGLFMGVDIKTEGDLKNVVRFFGTHFYIASQGACRELVKRAFPIDVQTDWYMSHMSTMDFIEMRGFPVSTQNPDLYGSSIQAICISCMIPIRSNLFWIILILLFISLIFAVIVLYKKNKTQCVNRI